MAKNLLVLLFTLALCYAGMELTFAALLSSGESLPLVKYQTERKNVQLWTYDGHFNGVADYDLRKETPYRELTYFANEDFDVSLEGIAPERVPHAIEVVFGPFAARERDHRELPKGTELTLVVGDSFCFGQGVRERDRFTNKLEEKLNAARDSESQPLQAVLSICYCGGDTPHAARMLREFSRNPNVRRAIYAYTLNDPVLDERLENMQKYINDFMHLRVRGRHGDLPEPERAATPLLQWLAAQSLNRRISSETIRWYHELHSGPTWKETEQIIVGMDEFAQSQGFPFTLVIFPLFHDFSHYPFRDIHETVRRFAEESGIEVVDLLEPFEGTNERRFWVHPKDFHPNQRAHAIVADFLYERMRW